MKKNMGTADRAIRILVAAVFIYLYFSGTVSGILGTIILILGIVFIGTSIIGSCLLYNLFGINTCRTAKE